MGGGSNFLYYYEQKCLKYLLFYHYFIFAIILLEIPRYTGRKSLVRSQVSCGDLEPLEANIFIFNLQSHYVL